MTILEDDNGNPLDVGRRTRSIPPALRRALKSRDNGCRFPGCTHQRYVDGHHVHHWAQGGETKLGNLISLCRFHHRLVHEGGVRVETLAEAQWRFHLPSGVVLETAATPRHRRAEAMSASEGGPASRPDRDHVSLDLNHEERWSEVIATNTAHAIRITPQTAVTRWRGESVDYSIALGALCRRTQRGSDVSAGTDPARVPAP